jgi:hypothetical protein
VSLVLSTLLALLCLYRLRGEPRAIAIAS